MKTSAVNFFLANAGFCYDPKTETAQQGRQRCAERLADAEEWAQSQSNLRFDWTEDGNTNREWTSEGEEYNTWQCILWRGRHIVTSLGGIDLGEDGDSNYTRVVEAELALEAMPERGLEVVAQPLAFPALLVVHLGADVVSVDIARDPGDVDSKRASVQHGGGGEFSLSVVPLSLVLAAPALTEGFNGSGLCDECGAVTGADAVNCPDGAHICRPCFEAGAH